MTPELFADCETVDVEFWKFEELEHLSHLAEAHDDEHATIACETILELFKTTFRTTGVKCACCPRKVKVTENTTRRLGRCKTVVAWTYPAPGVTRAAPFLICPTCVVKGPEHVQEVAIGFMWQTWPTALAIRVTHDFDITGRSIKCLNT